MVEGQFLHVETDLLVVEEGDEVEGRDSLQQQVVFVFQVGEVVQQLV